MTDLGGTIKIGQPKTTLPTQIVKEAFLNKKQAKPKTDHPIHRHKQHPSRYDT